MDRIYSCASKKHLEDVRFCPMTRAVEQPEALRGRQHVGEDDPGGEAALVRPRIAEPRVELAAAVLRDAVRAAPGSASGGVGSARISRCDTILLHSRLMLPAFTGRAE